MAKKSAKRRKKSCLRDIEVINLPPVTVRRDEIKSGKRGLKATLLTNQPK